jgi:hypothetical protein
MPLRSLSEHEHGGRYRLGPPNWWTPDGLIGPDPHRGKSRNSLAAP